MKIHLDQIRDGGEDIEGTLPASVIDNPGDGVRFDGVIHYKVFVLRDKTGFTVSGRLWTEATLTCGRCAEPFPLPITVGNFAVSKECNIECADLTEEVREDILLALPLIPKCELRSDGSCSIVKTRWNESKMKESQADESQQPVQGEDVWKALDKVNLENKTKKKR